MDSEDPNMQLQIKAGELLSGAGEDENRRRLVPKQPRAKRKVDDDHRPEFWTLPISNTDKEYPPDH
jgi:hypothetical protein